MNHSLMQKPAIMITSKRRRITRLLEMAARSTTPPFHKFNFLSTIEIKKKNQYDLSTQSNEMVLGPSNSYGLSSAYYIIL